ncbi:ATP-binding protein [Candidatus Woesearchaeota archaeon]|nr:ATP-binding protein [Candidatus Woesearchaeota archaeon]
MVIGQVISGRFGEICIRQKSNQDIELGELLVAENDKTKIIFQVYDLIYGSQISQQNLELISGLSLEENNDYNFMNPNLRNYKLAMLKNILTIKDKNSINEKYEGQDAISCKILPDFFSTVRKIKASDLDFLTTPSDPVFLGFLRSGSKQLEVPINLQGNLVLSHHILITATTGKGKSNLIRVLLWNCMEKDFCGFLVLDPHDEYYGRHGSGLKDHPSKKVSYYTNSNPPPGCNQLKININLIEPEHFKGVLFFTDAQNDALRAYYKEYKKDWIKAIFLEEPVQGSFHESTLGVIKRKLVNLLDISVIDGELQCRGIFNTTGGENTIAQIVSELENAATVIIDTSSFSDAGEILIGSLVANHVFGSYKNCLKTGKLKEKPVISIILEEAPRVLGKEVLESGHNIFSTIAREGRKFKIGLCAITQLPSLIPRTVLANMNTKIILGLEMAPERQSIIESAAQDLSTDSRAIASLDKGEAIVSSNFARFAIPLRIPFFPEFIKKEKINKPKSDYSSMTG